VTWIPGWKVLQYFENIETFLNKNVVYGIEYLTDVYYANPAWM